MKSLVASVLLLMGMAATSQTIQPPASTSQVTNMVANGFYVSPAGLGDFNTYVVKPEIGTGGSGVSTNLVSDPDANAYIVAAHITNSYAQTWINAAVMQLKNMGTWSRVADVGFYEYPFFNPSYPLTLKLRPMTNDASNVTTGDGTYCPPGSAGIQVGGLPSLTSFTLVAAYRCSTNQWSYNGADVQGQNIFGLYDASGSNGLTAKLNNDAGGYLYTVPCSNSIASDNESSFGCQLPKFIGSDWAYNAGGGPFSGISSYSGHSLAEYDVMAVKFDGTNLAYAFDGVPTRIGQLGTSTSAVCSPSLAGVSFNTFSVGQYGTRTPDGYPNNNFAGNIKAFVILNGVASPADDDAIFQSLQNLEAKSENVILFGHSQGCNYTYGTALYNTNGWLNLYAQLPGVLNQKLCYNGSYASTDWAFFLNNYANWGSKLIYSLRPASAGGCYRTQKETVVLNFGYNDIAVDNANNIMLENSTLSLLTLLPTYAETVLFNIRSCSTNAAQNQMNHWTNTASGYGYDAANQYNAWLATNNWPNVTVFDVATLFTTSELLTNNFTDSSGSHFLGPNGGAGNVRVAKAFQANRNPYNGGGYWNGVHVGNGGGLTNVASVGSSACYMTTGTFGGTNAAKFVSGTNIYYLLIP